MRRITVEGSYTNMGNTVEVMYSWENSGISIRTLGDSALSSSIRINKEMLKDHQDVVVELPDGPYKKLIILYVNKMLSVPELDQVSINKEILREIGNEFFKIESVVIDQLKLDGAGAGHNRTTELGVDELRGLMKYRSLMLSEIFKQWYIGQEENKKPSQTDPLVLGNIREKLQEQRVKPATTSSQEATDVKMKV